MVRVPRGKAWTSDEVRYLRQHRGQGARLLAHALGRTAKSVERKAESLGVSLRRTHGELCPRCGCYEVVPGTRAGASGLCPTCYRRELTKALEERNAQRRAMREYEAAKKRGQWRG